ncbi:MAG: long-chain fatty acid--CoA ligase, partial [Candidatus Eisenbacteria bacterium]
MAFTTLVELYRAAFREHPRADAFRRKIAGDWVDVSSAEAQRVIECVAAALAARGVAPGDRVAILSENRLEWALGDFGILTAGAATVPIYATLPAAQARHILNDSEARVVLVSTALQSAKVRSIADGLPALRTTVLMDAAPEDASGALTWDALIAEGAAALAADPAYATRLGNAVTPESVATLIYTSGTTGVPKGVILTHANLVSNVRDALLDFDIGPADSALSVLPLSHIFERMAGHYTMIANAVSVAYAESVEAFAANLQEVRPTLVFAVPRLFERIYARVVDAASAGGPIQRVIFVRARDVALRWARLVAARQPIPRGLALEHALHDRLVYAKLRARTGKRIRFFVSGGAPLGAEIAEFFLGAGLPVLEGYGLTETSPVIAVNRPARNKPGTVGPPIANVIVRIADDGEILVQGPGVMKGYFRLPDETRAALLDGWFHTGDIGHLDDDGHLVITDRKKDLLVTAGGKNVAPQPIENALKSSKFIAEAVLIGDQRPFISALIVPNFEQLELYARQKGISYVEHRDLVRHPGIVALLQGEVTAHTRGLARYEQIKRFRVLANEFSQDAGELTPTLKVRRKIVGQRYAHEIDALYQG